MATAQAIPTPSTAAIVTLTNANIQIVGLPV